MSLASRFQGSRNASRSNPKQTTLRRKAILAAVSHLCEPLEARRLLSDTPLVSVWTDQADYGFGTTAHIQAEYFVPGSTVNFHLAHQAGTPTDARVCHMPQDWQVVDGGAGDLDQTINGSVQTTWDVTDPDAVGATYVLMATGETDQGTMSAETTFTDSRTISSVTLNGGSSVTVRPGASIVASVSATTDNGGGNSNWRSTRWLISTTPPGTLTLEDHANHDSRGNYIESFPVTAPATAGIYNAYFIAYSDDDGTQQASARFTLTNAVIVDNTPPVAPGVALTNDTGVSAADRITSNGILTLTGVETGAMVQYSTNDGSIWSSSFTAVEGSNSVQVRQTDVAGNVGPASAAFTFTLDTTKPILSASINSEASTGWYNSSTGPAVVTYAASDIGGSGVTTPAPYTFTDGAGQSIAAITVTDVAGNTSIPAGGFSGIYQDRVAPSLSGAATTLPNANGWYSTDVTVRWTASDALSGLDPATVPADATITGQGDDLSASASVRDQAGNSASATVGGIKIDRTAPSTNATASGTKGLNNWYVSNVTVSLATAADRSGIAGTYYRIDGGAEQTYSDPFTVSADGPHTVTFCSVDKAGNSEAIRSISFKIDQTAPILSASINAPSATGWYNIATGPAIITYAASDATSGVTTPAPFTFADGIGLSHAGITVTDAAGNTSLATADVTGIMQDTIAPVLSASINAVTGTNGWYNASGKATVTYAVVENGSGATTPAPYTFGDGANQSLAAITVADAAGNVSNSAGAYNGISQDTVAPTIVASRTDQAYATAHSGWNNSAVTISFAATDSGSGVSSPANQVFSADGVYTSDATTVTDVAGNISAPASTFEIKIDQTAPTIDGAATTSPNANGWYKTDVTVHFTAGSDLSGVASLTPDTTISTEGAGQSATGTVIDVAGNSASATVTGINIDKTAPVLTYTRTAANAAGWNNTNVVVDFSATDALSGVEVDPVDVMLTGEGAGQFANATATDLAGNVASLMTAPDINIDKTAPTISGAPDRAANAAGWYNADVTVSWTVADSLSGVVSTPSAVKLGEGADQSTSATVYDLAGNSASATVGGINVDKTAPTVSAAATTLPNHNGWYNADVTVHFTASDGLSGLASIPTDQILSSEGAGVSSTAVTVTDLAGNVSAPSNVISVNIDKTAPVVTGAATTLPNGHGWYNSDVSIQWSVVESLSGAATPANSIISTEGRNQSATITVTDAAGNVGTGTVNGIKLDKTAPVITAQRNTAANANGWNNTDVASSYTAGDALSGLPADSESGSFTFTNEGAGQSHTFTVTDLAGNSASATVSDINIDKTAPIINGAADRAANAAGWYNADVTVSFSGADVLSGVDSLTAPVTLGEGGNQSVTGTVTDKAGNTATFTVSSINIDKTAPTVSTAATTSPNANGWYNSDVTVHFTASDGLSGLVSTPADQILRAEGPAVCSTAVTVMDLAGNVSALSNEVSVNIDKTAPIINAFRVTAANANGWNNTDVVVSYGASDGVSAIDAAASDAKPFTLAAEGAAQSHSFTVYDLAGNSASATVTDINIDKTAPTLRASINAPSATGWYNIASGPAIITYTASDATSGVTTPAPFTFADGIGLSHAGITVTDAAGNTSAPAETYRDIQQDTAAPTISITSPAGGASYLLNAMITPHADRSDAMSGIAGGSAPSTVDTSTVGTHTYTVTAIDKAGNGASMTNTYTVTYQATAFLNPISLGRTFKQGSTIPIQWQLMDANGKAITTLDAITSLTVTGTTPATLFPGNNYSSGATVLRNDGSQYIYNWQTKGFATGSYTITATLKDGNSVTASIALSTSGGAAKLMINSSAAAAGGASAGELLAGNLGVFVDNANGLITAEEMARISDAMATINATIGRYGAKLYQVDAADASAANVFLSIGDSSAIGGYAEGILGVTTESGGSIKLINGWNWFAGAEASQIGSGQYDFQTVLTHELGHVLGLGHSDNSGSVMYATLGQASVKHALTFADLQIADTDGEDVAPLRATPAQAPAAKPTSKFNAAARIQLTVPKAVDAIKLAAAQPPATPVAATPLVPSPVVLGTKRRIDEVFGRVVAALEN